MMTFCENCFHPIWPDDGQGHWMHLPKPSDTRRYERDRRLEGVMHCTEFDASVPGTAVATYGIEAWETDEPTLVVAGTHDPGIAYKVAHRMHEDLVGDVPENLKDALVEAEPYWFNRDHPEYDAEIWPEGVSSPTEREGDTPALRYGW